jgi:predicted small lipoprotein YifL
MPTRLKAFAAVSLLAVVAACGNKGRVADSYVAAPQSVTAEPVYTGKYN